MSARIDLDWQTDGNGRSWRTIWNTVGEKLGRIECKRDGYRAFIGNKPVGPWFDRMWEAISRFKRVTQVKMAEAAE
jgi:hypothetical protein